MSEKKFLYETHMHTLETSFCSITKAKAHVRLYKDRGYAGIIITDHLRSRNFQRGQFKNMKPLLSWEDKVNFLMRGYEKAKEEGDKIGLDVFFGWEFYTEGSEFLTYGLGKDFLLKHKDLDKLPLKEYSELVRANGGYLAQAHPYRYKDGKAVPVDPKLIDGVEIYNAGRTRKGKENAKAILFAREFNLPMQAGSDAHFPLLPMYSGVKLEKRAESIFDIINAIKDGTAEPILRSDEANLLSVDLETLRKETQMEEVSDLLVTVLYDCKHAKESAEDLCDYIQEYTEFDTVCAHVDKRGHIEKTGKKIKTIILGHHTGTKNELAQMKTIQNQNYGTKYGVDSDLCILTTSKSTLKKSKEDQRRFVVDFCKCFDENPDDMPLRAAQFKYVTLKFIENSLLDFLKFEQ